MDYQQRVLWHEGMFITPNHFQQADRHAASLLVRTARAIQPLLRGFSDLEADREALSAQMFALRSAAGVMPDGTAFAMPEVDELPPSRSFAERFASDRDRLGVHLCLPDLRPGSPSSDDPARPSPTPVRFTRRSARVRDEVHGGSEREIAIGVAGYAIRFDGEPLDGHVSLKVAEVVRSPGGGFTLDEDFAPPCLGWGAAPVVARVLRRMVDICGARSAELAGQRRQRTQGHVEFSVSETANYLLLHTLNGALPGLMHLAANPRTHPETVWCELARLAGFLHTFAAEGHPREIPPYRHDDLGGTFLALDARLRALIETNITARYIPLPLARGSGSVWTAKLPEIVLAGHRIYLAVQSSAASEKVAAQTPAKAKIASAGKVPLLVAQALKGLGLTYLSVPPGEIPAQPGSSYFELQRSGDEWGMVVESRTLGIFLPPDFTDLKMEFMALKE